MMTKSILALALSAALIACSSPTAPAQTTTNSPTPAPVEDQPTPPATEAPATPSTTQPLTVKIVPVDIQLPPCTKTPKKNCVSIKMSRVESNNQWVNEFFDKEIRAYGRVGKDMETKRDFATYQEMADAFVKDSNESLKDSVAAYELEATPSYHGTHGNAHMFTLKGYTYWGGAHGQPTTMHYLVDPSAQKQLKLADLLEPNKLPAFTELAHDAYRTWIKQHHPNDPKGHEEIYKFEIPPSITFTDKGVLLHYQPYDIDAFAAGEQSLVVPYDKLRGILKPIYFPTNAGKG